MLHLPRQPPGAAVRKRRGVWGAASSAWGWGGTPGPAGTGTQGLWGCLSHPPRRAGLESRLGTPRHLPFNRGLGSDNRDSLVVNCPSQRRTSSSCLVLQAGKGEGTRMSLRLRASGAAVSPLLIPERPGSWTLCSTSFPTFRRAGVLPTTCGLVMPKKV